MSGPPTPDHRAVELPYRALLRRNPVQQRSVRRVEDIVDAAAVLLSDRDPSRLTARDLAATAAVPTATVYQFFDDLDAVCQALAIRFMAAMPAVVEAAVAPRGPWETVIDDLIDGFAAMVRTHPAIRALWLSGVLGEATRTVERTLDRRIAERIGRTVVQRARDAGWSVADEPALVQWEVLVAIIDALLRRAFTLHPDGDDATLAEAARAARAYAAAVLSGVAR
ncbi:TetR family transcriptional regulator [Williamsia sp. CHRR-6]|uniref:TetR family transcriptional regulator n=1 Tax=Williamsia sp. CHRR-6 TaxID=2835871 RepID=UPI001BD99426|nr:TetR family transcriptional regulator [Williamsia sp. CHRR-6]MBT0567322.1 TetR family transcriptional regulator [Williamsia sp. CHRR-6]